MGDTNDLQATITLGPVSPGGRTLRLELAPKMTPPLPDQDDHPPDRIEASVHQAGLTAQRRLSRALIEKADRELVLRRRHGKAGDGIPRRGPRPFTFKTIFGEAAVRRSRIRHLHDGTMAVPSATAWGAPHQLAITRDPRDAVRDRMGDQSAGRSRADVGQAAGGEDLLGRSTIIEIVHRGGERLIAAQRQRARSARDDASQAPLGLLGRPAADAASGERCDVPPREDPEQARAGWERVQAEGSATGFPGCEPAYPVASGPPREVDPDHVIVGPDEVETEARPTPGRKEVWASTAVVLVAGGRSAFAEATAEGLWLRVGALLPEPGVVSGERRWLALGDGASWIRSWFEGLGVAPEAMIVCRWHLGERCYEAMSPAGGPRGRRRASEKEVLCRPWAGEVDAAVGPLRGASEWVRTPKGVEDLIGSLEERRASLPDSQERRRAGLGIASTRVEEFNDRAVSGRCKHRGMSWSAPGVVALAAPEAARRNGELEHWGQEDDLPERTLPEPIRKVARAR